MIRPSVAFYASECVRCWTSLVHSFFHLFPLLHLSPSSSAPSTSCPSFFRHHLRRLERCYCRIGTIFFFFQPFSLLVCCKPFRFDQSRLFIACGRSQLRCNIFRAVSWFQRFSTGDQALCSLTISAPTEQHSVKRKATQLRTIYDRLFRLRVVIVGGTASLL